MCDVKVFDMSHVHIWYTIYCNLHQYCEFLHFKAVTTTGEKIMDVELTDHNCSEVLRIFIKARNCKENEVKIKLF